MNGLRIGSMCSGYGGLDMGVIDAIGGEVAWHAESCADASRVLARHWPEVTNYGDIVAIDWAAVEPVDIVTAGFPCQPVSVAGQRAGTTDERWIWDDIRKAIGLLEPRPRLLVLENVPGLLTAGGGDAMASVVEGLASLGYMGRYGVYAAAEVGAPHRRRRWFCTAWPTDAPGLGREWSRCSRARRAGPANGIVTAPFTASEGLEARRQGWPRSSVVADSEGIREGKPSDPALTVATSRNARAVASSGSMRGSRFVADPAGLGHRDAWAESEPRVQAATVAGAATDASGYGRDTRRTQPARIERGPDTTQRSSIDWGRYGPAIAQWEHLTGVPTPAPTEPGPGGPRLAPAFVEWLMGLPAGHVTDTPGITRNAQLRILGNGVVPAQATYALADLLTTGDTP